MIRLTKLTDYALVLLTLISRYADRRTLTARDLAVESRIPLPTVTKLLKLLQQGGLLTSQRGTKGGYSLSRRPKKISLAEVISLLDGEIALTTCSDHSSESTCEIEDCCPTRANQQVISRAIRETLSRVTLEDLRRPMRLAPVGGSGGKSLVASITPQSHKVQI